MKRSALVLLALLVASAPLAASTFVALTPQQLVAQSSAVIQGDVLKVNSFWDESGRVIVSEAMIRVTDTILGDSPTVVVLRVQGGDVGNYRVVAEGFPTFHAGERVVLFLQHQTDGTDEVTGYRQGQYRIVTNKAGVDIAVPTLEPGVRLFTPDGRMAIRPSAVELDTLKAQIRSEAHRTALNRTTAE
jgi:hypothetical protein